MFDRQRAQIGDWLGIGLLRRGTFRVGFDGRWQAEFFSRDWAIDWARSVHDRTDALVWVVEWRRSRKTLVAAFPDDPATNDQWREGTSGAGLDWGSIPLSL
jgi:hypothetical protein